MNENGTTARMFDAPLDAWYVWIGLVAASGAAFAAASALPAAAPPDAGGAASAVDATAASEHAAVGEHPLPNADAVRVGSDALSLRGPGGTAHATLGYGPVAPAYRDDRLRAVLRGAPPEQTFDSRDEFAGAVTAAETAEPSWHRTERLTVRRVAWGEIDAVLVA